MNSKEIAIHTENLSKRYKDLMAVNRLNLSIKKGIIYGLLGPNGAGKTTTIKILCGLLRQTEGKAFIFENDCSTKSNSLLIGYMPQETALYLDLTVHQNLVLFGEIFGLSKSKILEREKELLEFVNMIDFKNQLVSNLSGGMKHRISLACSLIHDPKLLILDEPTIGIDPVLKASFWDYFYKLKDKGTTILVTTHYMDEARHCDKVGLLSEGKLIIDETPSEILKISRSDSLDDAFLKLYAKEGQR
jgi:ABC-2 type transport system ATP-binding protein